MFDYLTKASVINFKEFIVESISYLGWESNLSIRPPKFFKYCLEVSMNTNQWERLSWNLIYLMILTNNIANGVSSQLSGCCRAKLGPLGRRHIHLIFITELLVVWPVGHMNLIWQNGPLNQSKCPEMATYQSFIIVSIVCNKVTEE